MGIVARGIFATLTSLGLAGCMGSNLSTVERSSGDTTVATRNATSHQTLPSMNRFPMVAAEAPKRPNSEIGGDFIDLAFQLESGRALPVLSRFEGPISVRLSSTAPSYVRHDLSVLLARLRNEANISIGQVSSNAPASVNIELISKRELQRHVPHAACFVAPNVASWKAYKAAKRSAILDWTKLTERRQMAVFIPTGASPQETRDCLHEEIAQAIGPVNDLYRLKDSVFNDDNFNAILTGFDMLILKAYYAPELRSGMTRREVTAKLPAILARLNPAGGRNNLHLARPSPVAWKNSILKALGPQNASRARIGAARQAVAVARRQNLYDTRLAFSLYAEARLSMDSNAVRAYNAFREAEAIYANSGNSALQSAYIGVQLAAYNLSERRATDAISIVNRHLYTAKRAQNASLLATLMMIKAEALEMNNQPTAARQLRLDSMGWARYGFGSDKEVNARLRKIRAIARS